VILFSVRISNNKEQVAHQEVERRFMPVIKEGEYPSIISRLSTIASPVVLIKQGYFEVTNPAKSFRIRVIKKFLLQAKAFLTIKCGKGLVREEFEKEIDLELGEKLWEISHYKLEKMRHYVDGWEIDVFQGPLYGIILAEKEIGSIDESVELPPSLKSIFNEVREVTDSLTNHDLARLATDLKELGIPAISLVLKTKGSG